MEPLGILALVILVSSLVLGTHFRKKREAREARQHDLVPASRFTVRVHGWKRGELARISRDFAQSYGIPAPAVREAESGIYELHWGDGLNRDLLAFLVNYLHYPRDMDLEDRRILATLRIDPGVIEEVPPARTLLLYVPTDDQDFDRVHAIDDQGTAYVVDFGRVRYVPTDDARCPPQVRALIA